MKFSLNRKKGIGYQFKQLISLLKKVFKLKLVKIALIILFISLISPIFLFILLRPKPQAEINYGVTFSNKYATQVGLDWHDAFIKILDDLQVKNLRLVAYWDDIEANRDQYDYSDIKWQIEEAQKRNVNVILTMGRKVPRYPECFEPTWWNSIDNEEIRDFELLDYIRTTTNELSHYSNIKMWQVENEPFFPFGECKYDIKKQTVAKEIQLVRSLDPQNRPILVQDSGEGGYWFPSYALGDYLGISMYRKIWYDFWGVFGGKFIYFQYPLAHWTYKIKADIVRVPYQRIIVTELQAEPWGPRINSELTEEEKNHTMSKNDFLSTLSYAQKTGFRDLYLWGVEWWLWEKDVNNNSFYWDTAKALFGN